MRQRRRTDLRNPSFPPASYNRENPEGAPTKSGQPTRANVSLVDMARVIESAFVQVALRNNAQLEVIVEQMRELQEHARRPPVSLDARRERVRWHWPALLATESFTRSGPFEDW